MTVFILSDASFDITNQNTGISIKDMWTKEEIKENFKCNSSHEGEMRAIEKAIEYAISKNYSDPIFMYDDMKINAEELKNKYKIYFKTMQFVWVSREYISVVDELSKTARKEREEYTGQTRENISVYNYKIKVPLNFEEFMKFTDEDKIKFFAMYGSSKGNKKLYNAIIENNFENLGTGHRKYLEINGLYNMLSEKSYKDILIENTSDKRKDSVETKRGKEFLIQIFNEAFESFKTRKETKVNILEKNEISRKNFI